MKNYYDILEISKDANELEIKKGYRKKAIEFHPDKNLGDSIYENKFKELSEAYEVLKNKEKKLEYDKKINDLNKIKSEQANTTHSQQSKESHYNYKRRNPFFHTDYRKYSTKNEKPIKDFWGDDIKENLDFFKFPNKDIGIIIEGYTDLLKEDKPRDLMQILVTTLKAILFSSAFTTIVYWLFSMSSYFWLSFWFILPLISTYYLYRFKHTLYYVGINGFSYITVRGTKKNIKEQVEYNFNEFTDLYTVNEGRYRFFNKDTEVHYDSNAFITDYSDKKSSTEDKKRLAKMSNNFKGYFYKSIEKYWTLYLLDNLDNELNKNKYISFNIGYEKGSKFITEPYIQMGIGYIKFITEKGDISYQFNEIKSIYKKGNIMYIEHKNFKKEFFFFKKGNRDEIPIINLANRLFFDKAMEILVGWSFSK